MHDRLLSVLFLGLLTVGCGGENRPLTESDMEQTALNDVGELYRVYTIQFKKPPAKLADLVPLEQMSPIGLNAIKKGDVVVRYGAKLTSTNEGPGSEPTDEVLAYQKKTPESGGQVLMLNRTIKVMSADEFKSAKLAGTDAPAKSS